MLLFRCCRLFTYCTWQVIRINMISTEGFERFVGSRSTIQAVTFHPPHYDRDRCTCRAEAAIAGERTNVVIADANAVVAGCSPAELLADSTDEDVVGLSFEITQLEYATKPAFNMCVKEHPKWVLMPEVCDSYDVSFLFSTLILDVVFLFR